VLTAVAVYGVLGCAGTTAWRVLRLRVEERATVWRVAVDKLNRQLRTADWGCPPACGLGEVLTTSLRKKYPVR
jgi:hypothetical protein